MRPGFAASLLVSAAALASAQEPPPPAPPEEEQIVEIAIEREVVVTATKHEQSLWDAPATLYVLTEDDIKTSGARNLSDLLRQVPGMEAKTWLSEFQNLSLRGLLGASVVNERILWLLDGIPWNDVRDGGVWGGEELPLELIKRIEVQVGPGSTLYGANAFQGVIHIVTKGPQDFAEHGTELQVRRGSFDTTRGSVGIGRWDAERRRGFMVGATLATTDGSGHLVRDEFASGSNPAYPHGPSYEPNSERTFGYLRGKVVLGDATLLAGRRDVRLGYPGAYFAPFRSYDWKRAEEWVDATYERELRPGLTSETIGSWHRWTESFRNFSDIPEGPLPGNRYDVDSHRWFLEQRVFVASAAKVCPHGLTCADEALLKPRNQLFLGGAVRSESYQGNDFYPAFQDLSKTNFSLFAQDEVTLLRGRLTVNGGLRFDTHPDYDDVFSPRIAAIYSFGAGRGRVRVNYGSAYKEPANWQKYIDQPTGQGSPDLVPETLHMLEAAASWELRSDLHVRASVFAARQDDIITEFFDPTIADPRYVQFGIFGKFHPQQLGYDAEMRGFEAELRGRITGWVSGYANYSWLDAKVQRQASSLPPYAPPATPLEVDGEYDAHHRFNAGVTLDSDRFAVSAGVHYVGETTDTSLEFAPVAPSDPASPLIGIRPVPSYTIAEAVLRVRAIEDVSISVGGWNISSVVHEQMLGVPVPGPTFYVQVNYPY